MNLFLYDKTFEGLLSAVFYAYDAKIAPDKIIDNRIFQADLFAKRHTIYSNSEHATRVWNGVKKKTNKQICEKIYRVFLSEMEDVEMLIYKYIKLTFDSESYIDNNYSNNTILEFDRIYKKVIKEAYRAVMFIRFQKTSDGIYYAPFDPAYNVLPLVVDHFKDRFADQQWVIYDTKRNYGFYYDMKKVDEITINNSAINSITRKVGKEIMADDELDFQELWNNYYKSTTTPERLNLKLHKQFLPKRFWKYLPEKNFRI